MKLFRQVPKFQPVFEFANSESDDDGITTDERKEERAEKHGQKVEIYYFNIVFVQLEINDGERH